MHTNAHVLMQAGHCVSGINHFVRYDNLETVLLAYHVKFPKGTVSDEMVRQRTMYLNMVELVNT